MEEEVFSEICNEQNESLIKHELKEVKNISYIVVIQHNYILYLENDDYPLIVFYVKKER